MFLLVLAIWPTSLKTAWVGVPNFFIAVLSMVTRTVVTADVCIVWVDCVWIVMEHAQKPDFVFRRNGRVHLNRRGRQFSRLLAAEVCASAVIMLDTPRSEVVWRVLATHSIRQFPLHFPSRTSPCAITFQLDSNSFWRPQEQELLHHYSAVSSAWTFWRSTCREMKLSCHLYSHNSQCRRISDSLYELLGKAKESNSLICLFP
jgi:hypothetical protein